MVHPSECDVVQIMKKIVKSKSVILLLIIQKYIKSSTEKSSTVHIWMVGTAGLLKIETKMTLALRT